MKLFFISDIHGSLYYLQKALENFEKEAADYICILGDELYHGARNPLPQEYNTLKTAELLNQYAKKIIAVRGNCDSEVDEMVLDYPMMATYTSVLCNNRRLFLSHGHIYSEFNLPKLTDGDVFCIWTYTFAYSRKKRKYLYIQPRFNYFPERGLSEFLWHSGGKYTKNQDT